MFPPRRSCLLALAALATLSPVLPSRLGAAGPPAADHLTAAQRAAIGRKIWQNECAGSVDGLTTWNAGEEFPSLGIGHFIWYPAGFRGPFVETWPLFVAYARGRGAKLPAIATSQDCPWPNKAAFQTAFRGGAMSDLRKWLAANVSLQTDFIIERSRAALPTILAAAPRGDRARVEANYRKVAASPQGTYALIDYVNFKGEGTNAKECYQGQGWGLLQVLQGMRDAPAGPAAAKEFAAAAKRALDRRIANSPAARGEARWRAGWHNRCDTYGRPL